MDHRYRLHEDCKLFREMRSLSQSELADLLDLGIATINRWENEQAAPSERAIEKFYSNAWLSGIDLNRIKEQFYREELGDGDILLFHGAKKEIEGTIRCDVSGSRNDFGQGFYMGETFRQAALFVSNINTSSVYLLSFDPDDLAGVKYAVDTEWMLTIAYFRGRLKGQLTEGRESDICSKVLTADYIIAPIADNRMYRIIDSFIDGEITDEQCRHALAATDLGMQYVLKSEQAASHVTVLERCYLCIPERESFVSERGHDLRRADDKVRAARIKYRGKGKYIDELI